MRRNKNARARWMPKIEDLNIEFGKPLVMPVINMYHNKDYFGLSMIVLGFFSAAMITMGGSFAIALSRLG